MKWLFFLNNGKCWGQCLPLFLWALLSTIIVSAQPKVVPLYPGVAPGSEQWDWKEGETANTPIGFRIAYNVVTPTLTVYQPVKANGTAVILLPGGGMYVVNMEHEGHNVARELLKKGVTVFVLKYRTGRTTSNDPWQEMLANMKDTALNRRKLDGVRPLAIADAFAAIRYVRSHAAEHGLQANKIGVVGFSAGGSLALRLCMAVESEARPDFAGLVYSVYRPAPHDSLPRSVPPAFIACATDDALASPLNSTNLYAAWLQTGRPVELHIYSRGGHGLRGSKPATQWIDRFNEWLEVVGMMP